MSSVIYAFKRLQCLHLHFKRLQRLQSFTLSKDYNVFIYISKDFNVFSHLRFQKTTMSSFTFQKIVMSSVIYAFKKTTISSFTFQRLQHLLPFIGLSVLVFVLRRTRRSLFLCFGNIYIRTSNILHSIELQCPRVFSVWLPGRIARSLERN